MMKKLILCKRNIQVLLKDYNTLLDKVRVYNKKEALLVECNVKEVYPILDYINNCIKEENFLEPWFEFWLKHITLLECYREDLKRYKENCQSTSVRHNGKTTNI